MSDLKFTAFDIETTGFDAYDLVTVVGIKQPLGCRVFSLTGPSDEQIMTADDIEKAVASQQTTNIVVSVHESESALLEAVGGFATDRLQGEDILLVAYNGEQFKSGFDLPFLRTRLTLTGVEWPFGDLPYADLMPIVARRFNTTIDGDDRSDLVSAYDLLCDGGVSALDPFEESQEAVTAFNDGRIDDVVLHNVADVLRTAALGDLAQQYCSRSDFSLKSLTPATDA